MQIQAGREMMDGWRKFLLKVSSTRFGGVLMKATSAHVDPFLFRASGGRFTSIGPVVIPHVLLTTTGRKSGQHRDAQLVYTDIDGVVHIVASNFGGKSHPAWSYNLDASPQATMQLGSEPVDVTAELLSDAEKDEVWDRLVANIPNYDVYKTRTDRNIRVYRLVSTGG
jgi:deazaflavin-dependent oxidoreductase (nitroreductase family)